MQNTLPETLILGVDPGSNITGYAILLSKGKKLSLVKMDVIKLNAKEPIENRMKTLFDQMVTIIDSFHPDILAIEAPFYGKNVQSMLKLGRAQGLAIAAALSRDTPFVEYAPRRIKQSITGKGSASKEQVASMLQSIFALKTLPKYLDASDALAVAVCHSFQREITPLSTPSDTAPKTSPKKASSWTSFIAANPEKVKK